MPEKPLRIKKVTAEEKSIQEMYPQYAQVPKSSKGLPESEESK